MIHKDEPFDALADIWRRQLLVGLLDDEPQRVPRLSRSSREMLQAHESVLREYLSGSLEIANADKQAIRSYHVHLPKLARYDYIEWNRGATLVTKGPQFDDVQPLLEVVEAQRDDRATEDAPRLIRR